MTSIDTNRHEGYFKLFCERFPMWGEKTVKYVPKNMHTIRVTFSDGYELDYNALSGSFHFIRYDTSGDPKNLSDKECRDAFSVNLHEMMHTRGVSQTTLSERTGLSVTSISKYLRREATPTITNLRKIALALNCQEDELLY